MILKGSCLCKSVQYEITGRFEYVGNCHCSRCRKSHGAAFATFAGLAKRYFRFVSGESALSRYASSKAVTRYFCGTCGANLFTQLASRPDHLHFRLGTLDDDPGMKPTFHAFVASKAPWYEITDHLAQHERLPARP